MTLTAIALHDVRSCEQVRHLITPSNQFINRNTEYRCHPDQHVNGRVSVTVFNHANHPLSDIQLFRKFILCQTVFIADFLNIVSNNITSLLLRYVVYHTS